MAVRRVVTGQTASGKSIVVSDEQVIPLEMAVATHHSLWGADAPPHFPQDGSAPACSAAIFPGPGGYRFFTWTLAPNSVMAPSEEERAAMPPGVHMEVDVPGMHISDTVDLEIILSGEVDMELDDGEIVYLKAGDTLVQNGTRHRWFNRRDEPVTVAGVVIGGYARGER